MKAFIIGLIAVIVVGAFGLVSAYNGMVAKKETITARWAQVENQLQRRNDLIPNLVSSVKGYAAYEQGVFESVTAARSQWAKASNVDEKIGAASAMDSAIARLLAVAENYPVLKADQSFLKLMDELAGAENRIAVERMRFNDAVRDYNVAVKSFPGSIVARMFGFTAASEYFKADEKAKTVPVVSF